MQESISDFYVTNAAISKDAIVDLSVKASADTHPNKMMAVEGAAVDDNGNLIVPEAIKWASQEIATNGLNTAYCPSIGIAGLAALILQETVGAVTLKTLEEQGVTSAGLICSGGTNALSVPLAACTQPGDSIIVQNPHWSGYDSIALALGHKPLANFEFINKSGDFDFESFKQVVNNALPSSRLVIILNTPYDNPLAKEIKKESWLEIIKFLQGIKANQAKEIVIILDTAYMDFGPGGKDYNRLAFIVDLFNSLDDNFSLIIASTLSKSFAMYGARIAISSLLSKNKTKVAKWTDIAGGIIRGTYSSASRPGQELALNILQDPAKLANVHKYQADTVALVQSRQEVLLKELQRYEIFSDIKDGKNTPFQYIKPDGVFFTALKINDPSFAAKLYDAMLAEHLYIPIISGKYLRLPVCAMTADFIEKLVSKLATISNSCLSLKS